MAVQTEAGAAVRGVVCGGPAGYEQHLYSGTQGRRHSWN